VLVQPSWGEKGSELDVSAACAGSLYALSVADSMIKTGQAKRALVIGAELLTRISDWKDRATCVLFGDAAGAMVIAPETRADRGILSTHLYTDGTQADILNIPGGGSARPFSPKSGEARAPDQDERPRGVQDGGPGPGDGLARGPPAQRLSAEGRRLRGSRTRRISASWTR